jgi:hypothetical protein
MQRRIAIWASAGFLVACCWVVYTFVASPEQLILSLREPIIEAIGYVSLPIVFALRRFPLHFWWVPMINAATYAAIGLGLEVLHQRFHPRLAV